MISSLVDELRQMADGQATFHDARQVMLEAADTIWQLRDDLQRANAAVQDAEHDESMAWDRVRKAEAENDKLRELCGDIYEMAYHEYPSAFEATFADRMRELGVEVDR